MGALGNVLRRRPRTAIAALVVVAGIGAAGCLPPAPPPPTPPSPPPSPLALQSGTTSPFVDERTLGVGDGQDVTFVNRGALGTIGPFSVSFISPTGTGRWVVAAQRPYTECQRALAPGDTCVVPVHFLSTGVDGTGGVTLRITEPNSLPFDVPLTGTVRPDFEISGPTTISDAVDGVATTADYTISYLGDNITLANPDVDSTSGYFSPSPSQCASSALTPLFPTCTFTVGFLAATTGTFPAVVSVHGASLASLTEYSIVGTGT